MFYGSRCSFLFSVCLGCSCVSCSFWLCFNNLFWFLWSCFVVEGTLVGNFSLRCSVWAGCSNSSFSKRLVVLLGCFFFDCFSQMLNFWIDDLGVAFNGICIRFLEVCLSCCRRLFFYWCGFIFYIVELFEFPLLQLFLMFSFVDLMVFSQ